MRFLISTLFLVIFLSNTHSNGQNPGTDEIIKVETTLVSVPVIVSDRNGRYIPNLSISDFAVFQDGVKQNISFFANEKEPLSVALLLDTSLSTADVIGDIKRAAVEFVKQLEPGDRAAVVTFDSEVKVIQDLTSNRIELERAIRSTDIGFQVGTVLRDSVFGTTEQILNRASGRKAIIVLSDGKDFGSYETPNGLLERLEESDILVYSIFYKTGMQRSRPRRRGRFGRRNPRRDRRSDQIRKRQERMNKEAAEYLETMSKITAGRFYKKKVSDLRKTFRQITSELRNQYRLGYYPETVSTSGAVHKIKVRVNNRKNIAIRSRNTYRAK